MDPTVTERPPAAWLLEAYRSLRRIRGFEESLARLHAEGKTAGPVHLCIGQEAVAVGVAMAMGPDDLLASHHRGHGHCLARGADIRAIFAEVLGRASGVCGGRGGSMHLADLDRGILGTNGIVGAGVPIAVGAALSLQRRGVPGVAVAFCGDGALNQGGVHEALSLASLWNLPFLCVVENNGWAEYTPTEATSPVERLADRAAAWGLPAESVDGSDVLAVAERASHWILRARTGKGPALLECRTYRSTGHFLGDPLTYRPLAEAEQRIREGDPIPRFLDTVVARGWLTEKDLRSIDREVEQLLAEAQAAAEAAPWPEPAALLRDVYGDQR